MKKRLADFKEHYQSFADSAASHDTFQRAFSEEDCAAIELFSDLISGCVKRMCIKRGLDISNRVGKKIGILDGKVSRGSGRTLKDGTTVEKFSTMSFLDWDDQRFRFHEFIKEKSNEISSFAHIIAKLDGEERYVVTADSLNFQELSIKALVSRGIDFVIGTKGDNRDILKRLREYFSWEMKQSVRLAHRPGAQPDIKEKKKEDGSDGLDDAEEQAGVKIKYDPDIHKYHCYVEPGHGEDAVYEHFSTTEVSKLDLENKWTGTKTFVCEVKRKIPHNKALRMSQEIWFFISSLEGIADNAEVCVICIRPPKSMFS
ncbi:MAG: hypothetical protein LBT59_30020 [Clostridiales bacterium]|nr:hypothetical protein [Clostridiales bacterium]